MIFSKYVSKHIIFLSVGTVVLTVHVSTPSSDLRKVWRAERHHWQNLQKMQERVSVLVLFFLFYTSKVQLTQHTQAGLKPCVHHGRRA